MEGKYLLLWIEYMLIVPIVRHEQLLSFWCISSGFLFSCLTSRNAVGPSFISLLLLKSWLLVQHMLMIEWCFHWTCSPFECQVCGRIKYGFLIFLSYDHHKRPHSLVVIYDTTSAELQELGKTILLMVS